MQISSWEYFLISLAVLSVIIAWYVLSRKKPKKPWYVHTERNWRAKSPSSDHEIIFSAFLIGDAGANTTKNPEPTMVILKQKLKMAQEKSAVFFLGDNIYPKGLPEPDNAFYAKAADHLMSQLQVCEEYKGRVCFISGNHDWNKGRRGGLKAVLRQQDFVDNFFGRDDFYLPRNGCPGPVVVPLYENLCAIVINTQWWVHKGKKPIGAKDGCTVQSEEDFFSTLEQVLDENKNKHLLVIGHHPMYSKAFHGGKFDVKQHLFPLTELHKKMYVPLPLAGSLYPIYRKYIGAREDMSHPRYKKMKKRLVQIFKNYPNLVYAAGHDHNLQYIRKASQHYIVSGSGSKVTYVHKGKGAAFTHAHKGFFRLNYFRKGDVWLEAWEPEEDGSPRLAYRSHIVWGE